MKEAGKDIVLRCAVPDAAVLTDVETGVRLEWTRSGGGQVQVRVPAALSERQLPFAVRIAKGR